MKTTTKPICASQKGKCVAYATEIVGSKWTPLLLYALSNGRNRFGELQEAVGGVNPRTLSARLDSLEQDGIIIKTAYNEMPPRVEYTLTAKGRDLLPIIESMIVWGEKHAV